MTAPGSGEQITTELAEVLWRRAAGPDSPPLREASPASQRVVHEDAAALLPVVEAYATRKAAEELRALRADIAAVADELEDDESIDIPPNVPLLVKALRALTATPNHGTDATT